MSELLNEYNTKLGMIDENNNFSLVSSNLDFFMNKLKDYVLIQYEYINNKNYLNFGRVIKTCDSIPELKMLDTIWFYLTENNIKLKNILSVKYFEKEIESDIIAVKYNKIYSKDQIIELNDNMSSSLINDLKKINDISLELFSIDKVYFKKKLMSLYIEMKSYEVINNTSNPEIYKSAVNFYNLMRSNTKVEIKNKKRQTHAESLDQAAKTNNINKEDLQVVLSTINGYRGKKLN